jgi:hypothetical protein
VVGQGSAPGSLTVGVLAGFAVGLVVAAVLVAGRSDDQPVLPADVTSVPSSTLMLPVIETVTTQATPLTVTQVVPVPAPTVTSTDTATVTQTPAPPPTSLPATTPPSRYSGDWSPPPPRV